MARLIILSAPSGAGKSTLAKALRERPPNLAVSISHTTRAPRPGEQDGVHYYFVAPAQFQEMIAADVFVEHARVFDNYYGTSRAEIERLLKTGKDVILDIDWQGARNIKRAFPDAVSIFILPPSRADLETRLRNRKQDSDEIIARRMRDAVSEMSHYKEFDFVVVNDDLEAAIGDIRAIVANRPEHRRPLTLEPATLIDAGMKFRLSRHALEEIERRGIPRDMLDELLRNPQQVLPDRDGKKVYQSQMEFGRSKLFLLRAIVNEAVNPAVVVTVYRTSQIGKYWRHA